MLHPLQHGQIITSPGCHFSYRVVGACCRLFDREQLPWPCCRLQWHSKEPSWRRIGRRLILDMASRAHPTYSVEMVGQGRSTPPTDFLEPMILTCYWVKLPQPMNEWWYSDRLRQDVPLSINPPALMTLLATRSTTVGTADDTKTAG